MKPLLLCLTIFTSTSLLAQCPTKVQHAGTMRETLKNGKTDAVLNLDTLEKKGLFGIGPLAKLAGEITVANGEIYVSSVGEDPKHRTLKTDQAGSPFFVYANVRTWTIIRSQSVNDIVEIDSVLNKTTIGGHGDCAFPFVIKGKFEKLKFHVLEGPGRKSVFEHHGVKGTLIGFFSRNHKGLFTHHDSNIHIHFLSDDKTLAGHVDNVVFLSDNVVWQIAD